MGASDMLVGNMVDIRQLKEFAEELPSFSLFREMIMSEPDMIQASEFVAKSVVWVKLFARESEKC